jgi:hypothetical protein
MTELLGRLGAVIGISLVITVLLLVLYQDDKSAGDTPNFTQATNATANGTP